MSDLDQNQLQQIQSKRRYNLSKIILFFSMGILIVISAFMLHNDVNSETVFTAVIGLIGTWIGTLLAFYYSKDNFDAATQSTQSLIDKMSGPERLNTTQARNVMLSTSEFKHLKLEEGDVEDKHKLKQLLEEYLTDFNRLPVLSNSNTPKYIVHRSIIDKFIAEKALSGEDVNELSLKNLVESDFAPQINLGFGTVNPTDSLSSIKSLMENLSSQNVLCSDVFVTSDGLKTGKVLGWITNVLISEQSKI